MEHSSLILYVSPTERALCLSSPDHVFEAFFVVYVQAGAFEAEHLVEVVKVRQANGTLSHLIRQLVLFHVPLIWALWVLFLSAVAKEALEWWGQRWLVLLFHELFLPLLAPPPQLFLLRCHGCLHYHLELVLGIGLNLLHLRKALDVLLVPLAKVNNVECLRPRSIALLNLLLYLSTPRLLDKSFVIP